jgi:hypothetical protein
MWLLPALLLLVSCGQQHEARTAREFVERYTKAWQREDVDAIVAMKYDLKKFDIARIPQGKEGLLTDYTFGKEKAEVEADIRARGFVYRLSTDLTYVSEQDHGDHIHVRVAQGAARSDIVLVRDGEALKMFPYPSWFE